MLTLGFLGTGIQITTFLHTVSLLETEGGGESVREKERLRQREEKERKRQKKTERD